MKSKKETISIKGFLEISIIRPEKVGGVVDVRGLVEPYYNRQTEFNHALITFGNFFDRMKGKRVPIDQRWGWKRRLTPKEVIIFPNDSAMDSLTRIANTEGAYEDLGFKKEYRKNLKLVLEEIKSGGLLNPQATRVAVKRAGVVAAEFLHGPNVTLVYEAKRLPFVDGTLGVGMDDEERILTLENLTGKEIEIDEVFLASGSTIMAFMVDCFTQGIKPKSLIIVAPFLAQQGAEAVLNLGSQIDWEIRILANRTYYWLNDYWYVLVTPEEKIWEEVSGGNRSKEVQAGGDAGDLTEID